MRLAHLSDLHLSASGRLLYGLVDSHAALRAALIRLAALQPAVDLVLLSGDLAAAGKADSYRFLAEQLARLALPYALLPGNHDDRDQLRAVFPGQPWGHRELCCQHRDWGMGSLILLDTLLPGEEAGEISAAQMAWLEAHCPEDRPVLLAMHHPPFKVGIAGMDAIRCRESEAFERWLAARRNVDALLCGHVHRFVVTRHGGVPALTAPSTAHQIAVQDGPLAWTEEAGGFLIHDWAPGQVPRTTYLPVFPAPIHVYED